MKAPTLLVLAAGMGSRYGGLKQVDPIGPSGEFMLDYSVFDAVRAGFRKVVFVIRREMESDFRELVARRIGEHVDVEVAFQEMSMLPGGLVAKVEREKPWGTGHAIWCAREFIDGPFLAINADDFYGLDAYERMADELVSDDANSAMVAYPLGNTLSDHGSVARGICQVDESSGTLVNVKEFTGIARGTNGRIVGSDLAGNQSELRDEMPISMNFWGFQADVFGPLEERFGAFLEGAGDTNPKAEFYIPSAVQELIEAGQIRVRVLHSDGKWLGVTYRADRALVVDQLAKLVDNGIYPNPLWDPTG